MQMPCAEGSSQAEPRICSQLVETGDALQQHVLTCLGLHNIMQLAGTCKAWRQLIIDTPLHQLSEHARRAVLPSGLTSTLPLLQLVKQQAQLVARLRGKHGFMPHLQHLSLKDELRDGINSGYAQQRGCPQWPRFFNIVWSPCTCLEDASPWLALEPYPSLWHGTQAPVVVDLETGQRVCLHRGSSSMWPLPDEDDLFHTAWLTAQPGRILTSLFEGMNGSIAFLADVHGSSVLPIVVPGGTSGAGHLGTSRFFRACSKEGSAVDMLCWILCLDSDPDVEFEAHIKVFDASNRQLLYQLNCPQQLHQDFLQLQSKGCSRDEAASNPALIEEGALEARQVLLSPSKELLAVFWKFFDTQTPTGSWVVRVGVSIHSAIEGDLLHSMPLTGCKQGNAHNSEPSWVPCSSNFMYVNDGGSLLVMASSGYNLWSNARASRNPSLSAVQARQVIHTNLSASPCGRWMLVIDVTAYTAPKQPGQAKSKTYTWQITLLKASTGQMLAGSFRHNGTKRTQSQWSMSGEICLLAEVGLVLVLSPRADSTCATFQQYELNGRPACKPGVCSKYLSLSPCGSTVVGLDLRVSALEHWQIPPGSSMVKEASSASRTLQPVSLSEVTPASQLPPVDNIVLHEAWHPVHRACIYAILSTDDSVHLIDARANRCVQSWRHDELHDAATPLDPDTSSADERNDEDIFGYVSYPGGEDYYDEWVPRVLSWSRDGRRLAIATGASTTSTASCCVLHFSDDFT